MNLTWHIKVVPGGIDEDTTNPLYRSVNSLVSLGRPFEGFSCCFFGNPESQTEALRWLGVFALTEKWIIFFPGFSFSPDHIERVRAGSNKKERRSNFIPDHITLERDLHSYHFTTPGDHPQRKQHQEAGCTVSLGQDRFLWFGMSVARDNLLREVKRKNALSWKVPQGDAQRRLDLVRTLQQSADYTSVSLPPDRREPGFLHFSFIVGSAGFPLFESKKAEQMAMPVGLPGLSKPLEGTLECLTSPPTRLSLAQTIDVQVSVLWVPSSLKELVVVSEASQTQPRVSEQNTSEL